MSESMGQEQDQDEGSVVTLEQFSAQLKEVREKKGLNIQSVATDLRLSSDLIKALESNDTANLPSKIFVMGYLRSYARLLNVDESDLEQLDLSAIHQTVDVKSSFTGKPEKNSKHLSIRLVTYLVTAGMLLLLVLWWLSMQTNLTDIMTGEKYPQQEGSTGSTLALPENDAELSEFQGMENTPESEGVTVVESAAIEFPDVSTEKNKVQISEELPNDSESVSVESDDPVVNAEPIAQSELMLTYLEDSWSEVSDATGSRLLYGLYKEGREVTVQGVAPFSLFFGYAPGVVVIHNEEQFDHIAYHRNGVARFKVGMAEDNHLPNAD